MVTKLDERLAIEDFNFKFKFTKLACKLLVSTRVTTFHFESPF